MGGLGIGKSLPIGSSVWRGQDDETSGAEVYAQHLVRRSFVKHSTTIAILLAIATTVLGGGCSLFPETRYRESVHNPFPQMKRVAVLPFYNQSTEPTVDTNLATEAYYASLQAVPGFEVLPVGVAKAQWLRYAMAYGEPTSGEDFQRLAQMMGVEAVVVGSVTDFSAYYPPRMAMTTHWYAANEGFHRIPAGYGLPWGTEAEKQIPSRIAREAEFELARSQLATQTPTPPIVGEPIGNQPTSHAAAIRRTAGDPIELGDEIVPGDSGIVIHDPSMGGDVVYGDQVYGDQNYSEQFHAGDDFAIYGGDQIDTPMPPDWPDPTDLIPDPPSPVRPTAIVNREPVLSHTRIYRGDDPYFTNRLSDYVETGDDARPGGWQGYLKRSDDFTRFCCHLHIMEMLESRGGKDDSELILRWPLSRY